MSAVHTIPPTSTGPIRQGLGLPDAFNPPAPLPPDWPVPAEAPPPSDQSPSSSPSSLVAHTSSLPPLTPDQDRLFEALAKGHTSPSELSATLNLPVRQVLNLLATPEITFHLQVLENATDYLARHTTSLRHNLAFKSLEKALTAAAAKDNPAEIRRIATLLLKPTPPLPDPEAEQAERAERITKHRRAVSSLPLPLPAGEGRGEGVKTQHVQAPQRAATPTTPPQAPATPAAPAAQSPSHLVTGSLSHSSPPHSPAQPRAA